MVAELLLRDPAGDPAELLHVHSDGLQGEDSQSVTVSKSLDDFQQGLDLIGREFQSIPCTSNIVP